MGKNLIEAPFGRTKGTLCGRTPKSVEKGAYCVVKNGETFKGAGGGGGGGGGERRASLDMAAHCSTVPGIARAACLQDFGGFGLQFTI